MSQRRKSLRHRNFSSQQNKDESYSNHDNNDIVNDMVRYIVYKGGEHMIFSKSELVRNVIHKTGNQYEDIINKVREILENIYGYKMILCDSAKGKEKMYVVTNILPYMLNPYEEQENIPEDVHKILILLILSHIFMSNNLVSDASLYSFLNFLKIDVEVKHPLFGKVKDFITKTLVRKHYLKCDTDSISKIQTFKWGIRAEKEISKKAILEFICQMYKDRKPKDWSQQFQIATEQSEVETAQEIPLNQE